MIFRGSKVYTSKVTSTLSFPPLFGSSGLMHSAANTTAATSISTDAIFLN